MPRRPPSKPYTGHLAKPVSDLSWTQDELDSLLGAQLQRLFDHYEIPVGDQEAPDMWMKLVYALACDHVPGFQFEKPRGARPYSLDDDITIYCALTAAKNRGKNISQAARDLADWGAAEGRLRGMSAKKDRDYPLSTVRAST